MQIGHWGTFSKGQIKEWESTAITVPVKRKLVTSILNPVTEQIKQMPKEEHFEVTLGKTL